MRGSYHTDGKRLLLTFLREHAATPLTIEEIATALPPEAAPAKSTLYRLMTELVGEGTVRRFVRGNSRQFTYQVFGGEDCHGHLHLKCVDCGRVVHLEQEASAYIAETLLKEHRFAADRRATVLFGRCEDCAEIKETAT